MRPRTSSLAFGLIAMMFAQSGAFATVKLRPTPQKFRAFYAIDDARVPLSIRNQHAEPARNARRGSARWTIEEDALIRNSVPRVRLSFDDGLPVGGLRVIAITTDGAVWAGGDKGLVRYEDSPNAWDRWQYFGGQRYLPSDDVTSLAAGEAGSIWVQTPAGVSHIQFRRFTLADKAAYFERRIAERHKRHYLVADSEFSEPGNPATSHQYPNDNDGLWTAIYVASQAFRYRLTKDSQALDSTRKSVDAMLRLEAITGLAGFPARSFRQKNEPRHKDGIWHFTADGEWEWKADTSSDEIVG
ncbi:MAG: hypothetical protein WAV47_06200, partial [Blastocatellia bacterium]